MKLFAILALSGLSVACDDTDFTGGDGGSVILGDDFCAVETIFEVECIVCHSTSSALGGLDLETDALTALVSVTASNDNTQTLVIPGDAAGSLLYTMMAGTPPNGLNAMPKGGTVNKDFAKVVELWINDGAKPCGCDTGLDTGASGDTGDNGGAE
jgi:hypothetical protein